MIQNRPILFNENDVRVLLNDPCRGGIRPAGADDLDVEQKTALHRNGLKCRCVEVGRELFDRFPAHSGDDLQLRLLVASEDADGGGGREALAVSSVRNDHALHILDDVSADDNPHLVRKTTERRAGIAVLSDNATGYYLPANEEEKARFVRSMRHRAKEILLAADAVERT